VRHFIFKRKSYKGAGIALFREEPNKGFNVLLGQRKYNPGKNKWSFPGGAMEPRDTSFQETACREFSEEAGVSLPELDAKDITDCYEINLPFFHWKTFIYTTKSNTSFTRIREFTKLDWVNEEDFLKLPKHFWVKPVYRMYKKYRNTQ
jgi:8-oxo-dGTP pyrophosphatase MutT (NUDIX family)